MSACASAAFPPLLNFLEGHFAGFYVQRRTAQQKQSPLKIGALKKAKVVDPQQQQQQPNYRRVIIEGTISNRLISNDIMCSKFFPPFFVRTTTTPSTTLSMKNCDWSTKIERKRLK